MTTVQKSTSKANLRLLTRILEDKIARARLNRLDDAYADSCEVAIHAMNASCRLNENATVRRVQWRLHMSLYRH